MTTEIIVALAVGGPILLYFLLTQGRRNDEQLGLIHEWARNNQMSVVEARLARVGEWKKVDTYRVTFRDQRGELVSGWARPVTEGLLADPELKVTLDW